MALIGKIRNNLWFVIILLGIALLAFLLMDMSAGNNSLFGGPNQSVGKIGGKKVGVQDFEQMTRARYGGGGGDYYAQRNAMWNDLVNESIVQEEAEKLGLAVTEEEMTGLIYGPNYSPIIRQDFTNPQLRGQVDVEQLNQIRDLEASGNLNPEFVPRWNEEKNRVKQAQLQTKLSNLVSKSIYIPNWMAEMQSTDLNGQAKVQYVQIPFDRIEKNEVALSDDDFKNYLEENRAIYKTDLPTQTLEYTVFNVEPTAKDSADIVAELTNKRADFAKVSGDDIQYFAEGEGGSYSKAYFKKDELSPVIADSLMGASVGQMFGPYKDGDQYKVARVIGFKTVPDSIQARHILRNANAADPMAMQAARDTIEMLKNMMENEGANFDTLALKYGQDGTSFRGGDLGTFGAADPNGLQPRQGTMVGPFNDLVFYEAEPKKFYTVETEFGVHLVQVTKRKDSGKKGVRVAYLTKDIIPSDATQKKMYSEALRFAQENNTIEKLRTAVENDTRLEMTTTLPLDENGFFIQDLGGGEDTRNMVKWANEASVGQVSPVVYRYADEARYFDNKYVVASLSERTPAGLPSVAASKKALEGVVLNEKKGELIASKITDGMDLNAIAGLYEEVTVDSADVAFKGFAPKIGNESEFLGALFSLEEGQMTKPVIGNTGVFVGKMISKPAPVAATNLPQLKRQLSSQYKGRATNAIVPALKENTKIEDKRVDFF